MKVYVPTNSFGIEELNNGQELETNNLKVFEFSPSDYYYLEEQKYFDFLNVECNCLIDLYEVEDIPVEKICKAIEITNILINQINEERFLKLANDFINIFDLAVKSNTYVSIYCYGDPNIINE